MDDLGRNETSPEEDLEAVIEALDFADAPRTDAALDGVCRRLGHELCGYSPAGRVRALYGRERIEANRQRARAEKAEALIRPGDQLQSSASRLAEWVLNVSADDEFAPYEVRMAALEAQSAVKEWTEIRRKF